MKTRTNSTFLEVNKKINIEVVHFQILTKVIFLLKSGNTQNNQPTTLGLPVYNQININI